jgi:hypothetical protein
MERDLSGNESCRVDCRYRRTLVPTTDGQRGRLRLARARRLADSITDDGQLYWASLNLEPLDF